MFVCGLSSKHCNLLLVSKGSAYGDFDLDYPTPLIPANAEILRISLIDPGSSPIDIGRDRDER